MPEVTVWSLSQDLLAHAHSSLVLEQVPEVQLTCPLCLVVTCWLQGGCLLTRPKRRLVLHVRIRLHDRWLLSACHVQVLLQIVGATSLPSGSSRSCHNRGSMSGHSGRKKKQFREQNDRVEGGGRCLVCSGNVSDRVTRARGLNGRRAVVQGGPPERRGCGSCTGGPEMA